MGGDFDKLKTTYYCLNHNESQYSLFSGSHTNGLITLAKITECYNSRDCANVTCKIANGMTHENKNWFLPTKFEGIHNDPIFKFTRETDEAVLIAININGLGTPYGLWLKADGTVGIEGYYNNRFIEYTNNICSEFCLLICNT